MGLSRLLPVQHRTGNGSRIHRYFLGRKALKYNENIIVFYQEKRFMPGLKLFTSNRMEILVRHLSDVLKVPLAQPLAGEIILVQSKGMERWLSMELARCHGICANVRFPYPIHFVHSIFREILPCAPEHSPYEPMTMTWDIMHLLPSLLDNPGFQNLKSYLGGDAPDLKLFQLSSRVADLLDQYLLFRPDMMLQWDRGLEDHWQATLWRELVKKHGAIHRAALCDALLHSMKETVILLKNIPDRISIFGISALPPFYIQIFLVLSSLIDVNMFLVNPCREFWGDIVSDHEMGRFTTVGKSKDVLPRDLYLETGNRLLASMGALGREFFRLVGDIHCEETSAFEDPGDRTLLAAIQSDILNLRERNYREENVIQEADDSIRIHSCHSPLREIEALQDALLNLFEKHPDIRPDDILVMIPDIELYAPFVQAVFSIPTDDPRWLPFTIADRGLLSESGLIDTFIRLLELAGSRYEASRVMDILEADAVRSRFSIAEEDLALIHHWIRETGIRWGIDGENRNKLGLPAFPWNTWRAGLDRMLLGYTLPTGSGDGLFMEILPFSDIEGGNTETLGSFLKFAETLFRVTSALDEKKNLNGWADILLEIIDSFFADDERHLRDIHAIRRVVHELFDIQSASGFDEKVALDVIKAWLRQKLKEKGFGAGFLTGGVTFCAILPMRSIPFKVICLVGMSDDAYPRQSRRLGFDLMAASPRIGDRSRRMDDRYLFLEAILSARMKLHISYVGQSLKDNSLRPPSVLVSELLDYIEEGFGEIVRGRMVVPHRLQAFSPDYFSDKGCLFSYSTENFRAAQSVLFNRREPTAFISSILSDPEAEWKTVDLESLIFFFTNPARFLLNRRLGIYLNEEPDVLDDSEPFNLDNLERFRIRQELVERALEDQTLFNVYPVMQASGKLPHGSPGVCFYDDLCASARDYARKIRPRIEGGPIEPAAVDIIVDGFHLTGMLANIYPEGLVCYRMAKMKGRDRLRAWISHLVFNYLHKETTAPCTVVIFDDRAYRYAQVKEPEAHLRIILNIYLRGLLQPLHFFPESSLLYAERMAKGKGPDKAMRAAAGKWDAPKFAEKVNPYYDLCFNQIDPLDDEFCELSTALYEPMLDHEKTIK
jgi:exodeoxyribonuclease V gamma subunit